MRVRVTKKPPVEAKHEIEIGNEYETVDEVVSSSVWIMGAAGEKVRLLSHEWEAVGADEEE